MLGGRVRFYHKNILHAKFDRIRIIRIDMLAHMDERTVGQMYETTSSYIVTLRNSISLLV